MNAYPSTAGVALIGLSLLLQALGAAQALRLIRMTGWMAAWAMIAAALLLMTFRRAVSLWHLLSGENVRIDLPAEGLALAISILILIGVLRIGNLLHKLVDAQERTAVLCRAQEAFIRGADHLGPEVFHSLEKDLARHLRCWKVVIGFQGDTDESGTRAIGARDLEAAAILADIQTSLIRDPSAPAFRVGCVTDSAGHKLNWVAVPLLSSGDLVGSMLLLRPPGRSRWSRGDLEAVGLAVGNLVAASQHRRQRDRHNRLLAITSTLFEGVLLVTESGEIVFANQSARRLLGTEALVGRSLDEVMTLLARGEPVAFAQGPFRRVIDTGAAAVDDDAVCATPDGRRLAIAYAATQLREEGKPDAAVISFRDIEALKTAQREALQASRLASVGQLAAGIAHEINTPVQYIGDNLRFIDDALAKIGNVLVAGQDLVAGGMTPSAPAARFEVAVKAAKLPFLLAEAPVALRESLDGVAQIARIVLSMKEFSHPGTSTKTMTDLNRALDSTLTVSHSVWKEVAEAETDFDPALPPVLCHAGEINQVFLNLIVNAAHAIEASGKPLPGRITVTTRHGGDYVEVTVADSGTGVPESIRDRIFDPFFTTKAVGKGTGQGLAICRDVVVTKHGGSLEVGGTEGDGALFIVRLPVEGGGARAEASPRT